MSLSDKPTLAITDQYRNKTSMNTCWTKVNWNSNQMSPVLVIISYCCFFANYSFSLILFLPPFREDFWRYSVTEYLLIPNSKHFRVKPHFLKSYCILPNTSTHLTPTAISPTSPYCVFSISNIHSTCSKYRSVSGSLWSILTNRSNKYRNMYRKKNHSSFKILVIPWKKVREKGR